MPYYVIDEVVEIRAGADEGYYSIDLWLTIGSGPSDWTPGYWLSPTDPYGAAPTLRQWMIDNPEFPIQPYVPPE